MRALWFTSLPDHDDALTEVRAALALNGSLERHDGRDFLMPPTCECRVFDVPESVQQSLIDAATLAQTDVLLVGSERPKLGIFDMDSTLIQHEVIDELAAAFGLGPQVAAITERAMQGELDFVQSFTERLALLDGLAESELQNVYARLQLMPGAECLMRNLSTRGIRVGIVSGGFSYFADQIAGRLGMDFVISNTLECQGGFVTGRVVAPVIDGSMKEATLRAESERMGISIEQTLAVGDGANDIPMLKRAGIGVAFRAKPKVQAQCANRLNHQDLSALSYLVVH